MKVSHVMFMSELPGVYPVSGLENHLFILLPALQRAGVDAELIVVTWNIGPELRARLADLEAQGVAVTVVRCSPRRRVRWLGLRRLEQAAQLRAVLAARRDCIVHLHVDLGLAGLTLVAARTWRVVMSIHNDGPYMLRPLWRAYLHALDRRVGRYIAISERVRRHYLAASGAAPGKITRIYYGVPAPGPQQAAQAIRRRYGIPGDRFVAGFVGRLAEQKNVPLLLAALERLGDVHGVIVGDGELRPALEAWVRERGLANVQFLGRVAGAADLMPAFDLLCLPSRFEGLGLVLVEAMLRGVAIAGSRAGAIPEILGDGEYGLLFDPDDVAGLVAAVDAARSDPAATRAMAERALAYAQRTFSVEAMAQQTVAVYHDLERMREGRG